LIPILSAPSDSPALESFVSTFFRTGLEPKGLDAISSPPFNPYTFQRRYVSAHSRARLVSVLLIVGAVLSFGAALLSLLQLFSPQLFTSGDEEITDPVVLVVALLELGLGLVYLVVYIATIVVFLMWLYRSYENLPSFGVPRNRISYSSGWAIGSFFIPFVSLVVPYRAIRELWTKSLPNYNEMLSDPGPPAFFPLWWAAWLVSNFINQIHFRLSWRENITSELSGTLGVVAGVMDILSAILAIMVVKEIDRQQTESEKLIPRESLSGQPPPPPTLAPG